SSFCGTVGLKPTYGRVSLAGVFPLAPSLDHVGPMARTPADAALLFGVIADSARPGRSDGVAAPADDRLLGVPVGLGPDLHLVPPTPEVDRALRAAADAAAGLGAELVATELPEAAGAYEAFGRIQRCEALQTHTDAGLYPARREEYGTDVLSRLDLALTM